MGDERRMKSSIRVWSRVPGSMARQLSLPKVRSLESSPWRRCFSDPFPSRVAVWYDHGLAESIKAFTRMMSVSLREGTSLTFSYAIVERPLGILVCRLVSS